MFHSLQQSCSSASAVLCEQSSPALPALSDNSFREYLNKLTCLVGSGKSVLRSVHSEHDQSLGQVNTYSAAIVDSLLLEPLPPTSLRTYFFCEYDNAHSLTARAILGCLARQSLAQDNPTLLGELQSLFDADPPDEDDITTFFIQHSNASRVHFILIDGLDECAELEREIVLNTLEALLRLESPRFRIFLSGRDSIVSETRHMLKPGYYQTMNCAEVAEDIEAVIGALIDEKKQRRKLVLQDPNLEDEIISALKTGAKGM